MMANRSRVLILVASLALGLMYTLPLWTIDLEAPQYPEGLGMVIRINTIEGKKKHDLANINNLNHYIGMQRIVPESIPELKIMPVVVAVLIVLGSLVALIGRKRVLYGWVTLFIGISLVGIADFWKWEYDYGHNLDEENAIIKIPGMSYQPPLIGSRQILNFTAHSWPGGGGLAAILAGMTFVAVAGTEWRRGRNGTSRRGKTSEGGATGKGPDQGDTGDASPTTLRSTATAAALMLMVSGCGDPQPRAVVAGVDGCADCLMMLDATGHGSELVTTTGKIYTFDSIECMNNYVFTYDGDEVPHSLWVTDFSNPDRLVEANEAYYLRSEALSSPMGLGITAFSRLEDRDGAVHAFGGDALDWHAVRALVAEAWPEGRPTFKHGGHTSTLVPGPTRDSGSATARSGG